MVDGHVGDRDSDLACGDQSKNTTFIPVNVSVKSCSFLRVLGLTWLADRASRVWSLSRTLCMSSCSLANATTICSFRLPGAFAAPPQRPPSPPPVLRRGATFPEPRLGDLEPEDHHNVAVIRGTGAADADRPGAHLSPV